MPVTGVQTCALPISFYELPARADIFRSWFLELKELVPKSEAQILIEAAADLESGVPMYYAEQLQ